MTPPGALRRVLAEITAARGTAHLGEIARRVGVSLEEARSMVDYWVGQGRLSRDEIGGGCPPQGCGGCPGAVTCTIPGDGDGPTLLAITATPRPARSTEGSGSAPRRAAPTRAWLG
ncbi:FeoC-like transcriptional regulator [Nonomuraea indica]|uniref:FeoC-like transcriptional regulator n=1 Tax=Nonomuraea indica TaxID=1581193 RepID=UPI0015DF12B9